DLLTGGQGNDLFVFFDGHGSDTIQDFQAGAGTEDRIDLMGVQNIRDMKTLLSLAEQNGDDVELHLNEEDVIHIKNTDLDHLHEDDFVF
ncbi:calcium-binding protein, partial [Magnetococcales bacterium HHB-1]